MPGSDLAGSSPVEHQPTGWTVEIIYFSHPRGEVERWRETMPATMDSSGLVSEA
jgi:hypothetical protein